jgi:tetratricopeptide (TPR) repeat protein
LAWSLIGHCMKTARFWELASAQTVALHAAQHAGEPAAAAYSLHTLALARSAVHDQQGAIAAEQRSIEICRRIGDRFHEARGLAGIAAAKSGMEDHVGCLDYALLALNVSRSLGADGHTEQARSLNLIGWSHAQLGNSDQAIAACEESLRLAEELGDLWTQAAALDSLAFAYRTDGAYAASAATYRRALAIHDRYGAASFRARTLTHLGDLLALTGDTASALGLFQEALTIFETTDERMAEDTRQQITRLSTNSPTPIRGPEPRASQHAL